MLILDMQKELLELQVVLLAEMRLIGNMLLNFKLEKIK